MLIYTMLKPGFYTKENIEELKRNYLTSKNNIEIIAESKVQYD